MSVCRNHELSLRSILFLTFLAYFVVWIHAYPVKWATMVTKVGPTPELANYSKLLGQIEEWAVDVPTYVITISVSLF